MDHRDGSRSARPTTRQDGRKSKVDPATATRDQVMQKAVDLLKRRAHTERELRQKLRQRRYPGAHIEGVIEECRARGWLGDSDVAAAFADELVRSGRYGPRRIVQKLQQRGITQDEAEIALEGAAENVDWVERARALVDKRTDAEVLEADERARLTRFLVGRGFSHEEISAALRRK